MCVISVHHRFWLHIYGSIKQYEKSFILGDHVRTLTIIGHRTLPFFMQTLIQVKLAMKMSVCGTKQLT